MSGRLGKDSRGQLALMDSMVFFAAALAICGVLVSYARPSIEQTADLQGDSDPAEVLRVFLRSSVGRSVSIDLEGNHRLDGTEDVATCIAVEVCALLSGANLIAFSSLNAVMLEMMSCICNPEFEPFLVVYNLDDQLPSPVLELPHKATDSENRYASSTEIPGNDGIPYIVILILYPAALPELL